MVKKLPEVEVLTVGAGWAGGIVAAELTKAGHQVLSLERGSERTIEDFLHSHDELKYGQKKELMKPITSDTVTVRNNEKQDSRPLRNIINHPIGTGTGGSGVHWAGQTYRYYPYDFEIKSKTIERYGEEKIPEGMTLQDWGITYNEIEPYYDKFEKMAGISGEDSKFTPERSNPYPTPPMKKTPAMKLFHEAAEKLGYHPYVQPSGNLSQAYENPDGEKINACQYCSFCSEYGCEYGAKSDPIVTVLSTAKKTGNHEVRYNSYVKRILHDGKKATGVLYVDLRTGEEFEQPAKIVVLTAYTLNNVRLLLLSEIGRKYDPVTGTGVIGKNLTDHHNYAGASGLFDDKKFNLYAGSGALGSSVSEFEADNVDHTNLDFIHGGVIALTQTGSPPITRNPVPPGTPSWGREFKKQSLHYFNRSLTVMTQRGVMPWKHNFIDLDSVYKDDFGDPLIRMTWDYSDNDRKIHEFMVEKCSEILKEMGATTVIPGGMAEHWQAFYVGLHLGGGAIMGADSETSAVNSYLQMWDMENLFVCGASAFPHFGTTNPTNTLGALTYRATEGMIEYLKTGGGLLVERENTKQNV
ncbi:GMC family oxidoreductase [Oceanobacillus saliphilus]|uniref:GMC family oxidoreductase n=1 Tax=Oceanobacillus saliphilus TaxID=2925834 RepID=UPI00201D7366|nr:GMC family oxidoreductase [Oceanobacillus saliphilus]